MGKRTFGVAALDQWERSDGVISIRPPRSEDLSVLIAGREDPESRRWLGDPEDDPDPTACITVDGEIVGWVDFDTDRDWLKPEEVNAGYAVFAPYRRRGYASRGLGLLTEHLTDLSEDQVARLSIDRGNTASIGVALRAGFELAVSDDNGVDFTRPIGRT